APHGGYKCPPEGTPARTSRWHTLGGLVRLRGVATRSLEAREACTVRAGGIIRQEAENDSGRVVSCLPAHGISHERPRRVERIATRGEVVELALGEAVEDAV